MKESRRGHGDKPDDPLWGEGAAKTVEVGDQAMIEGTAIRKSPQNLQWGDRQSESKKERGKSQLNKQDG